MSSASSLTIWSQRYRGWLLDTALPLWSSTGVRQETGGFVEVIDQAGAALPLPVRGRVCCRQVYALVTGAELGWRGPWQQPALAGLAHFRKHYRRPDGLYRTLADRDGNALDDRALLYDQAFMLLALSRCHRILPDARDEALAIAATLQATMRHAAGGFREENETPFQSNAHMHLLEACLAWIEADGAALWRQLAAELVELALTRFIDAGSGALRECFTADWTPHPGDKGRIVEPGHQFEWAWLLERWARLSGDMRASAAAERLNDVGEIGVDADRKVALDALNDDFSRRTDRARLWPQTERLKAALILAERAQGERRAELLASAEDACAALWRYLQTPIPGLWYDKHSGDGAFAEEPAPASSLYHIVAAIRQLDETVAGLVAADDRRAATG
ncbi:MAG TPA: AGE family epimerase/isomerase [Bosea sp. (in: a-proteobacteria)]|jgi:mannose-6-phosphate isomerase|uniref:AGE family epimerase/isomerase n=1 Tax=Bosea sp. (in: a-proteobacteria) TaxID=1871050 RepID=UPI002E15D97F|nr:AGE family epimerase/isomerase [Bosea sp. (in: a-proteobacteria)]